MDKVFKVADIRKFEQMVAKGDISYSRMVELMNEMAHTHYVVNKNCNVIPAVMGELTCDSCGCHPNVIYTTNKGRFCEKCKPAS